ncbi:hypothetical protein N0V90_004886 [Kalmusia sp. IMI 367209]|nr:hypothetical protein N0V90_004886 [Kalmusia sp. IMI 367209]
MIVNLQVIDNFKATFVGYVAAISVGIMYGIGKKYATVEPTNYSKAIMWEAIGQGICIMGIAASKSSVAVFLLRIVVTKWHKALLWFCIVSTTILCIITTTLLFLQCRPAAFLWDPTIEGGYCWLNFTRVGLTMGAWSAAMDFVLAILPWHVIMGLNMKRKEKLTVAFGLSLGLFAGICSIIRTYELQALSSLDEYVYDTVPMLLWSSTEVFATIVCACIPILRPLYVKIRHGSRGDSSSDPRSYPLSEYGKKEDSRYCGGVSSKVHMGTCASGGVQTNVRMGSDNASEESMLREHKFPVQGLEVEDGVIKRTDEIRVTSSAV